MKSARRWANRIRRSLMQSLKPPPLPQVIKDPEEALQHVSEGRSTVLLAPADACVMFNGLSPTPGGYHPFVAASREHIADPSKPYRGSALERYYLNWQPANALDALNAGLKGPVKLLGYPAYLMPEPWGDASFETRLAFVEQTMTWESRAFDPQGFGPADGHGLMGPVTERKAHAEATRLKQLIGSIRRSGYDLRKGLMTAQLLKCGDQLRYRIIHGHHRTGVLVALGYEKLPLELSQLVDISELARWPGVSDGRWSDAEAADYFHHHFRFDSGQWARERRLL